MFDILDEGASEGCKRKMRCWAIRTIHVLKEQKQL